MNKTTPIRYVGVKKRIHVPFPVPFISNSSLAEVVTFTRNVPQLIPTDWAQDLLKTSPDVFKLDESKTKALPWRGERSDVEGDSSPAPEAQ